MPLSLLLGLTFFYPVQEQDRLWRHSGHLESYYGRYINTLFKLETNFLNLEHILRMYIIIYYMFPEFSSYICCLKIKKKFFYIIREYFCTNNMEGKVKPFQVGINRIKLPVSEH